MSNRRFSRVRFNVEAAIRVGGRQFQGVVENLSMTGMFLVSDESLAVGEGVGITIMLTGTEPPIAVDFTGTVSRVSGNGIGFVFEKMDLNSYTHLKNIVAYNSDDAEKVLDDIRHSISAQQAAGLRDKMPR